MMYDNITTGTGATTTAFAFEKVPVLRDLCHYGNFWAAPCVIAAKGGRVYTEMINFFPPRAYKRRKVEASELVLYY